MATPPTLAAEYETTWTALTGGLTDRTVSVTVANGDLLTVCAVSEDVSKTLTVAGGGLTYTLRQQVTTASRCGVYIWTAPSVSAQTFTLTVTGSVANSSFGADVLRWSTHGGVGASSKTDATTAAPSLGLTTTGDNSAVVVIDGDWNAADGTTRTWRTVNSITPTAGNGLETTYFRDASFYAVYGAYYNDAGAAGSKTVGLTTPSQQYSIAAVEVLGTAGAAQPPPQPALVVPRLAVMQGSTW